MRSHRGNECARPFDMTIASAAHLSEVRGPTRIVYDITSKSGTIERE